MSLVKIEKILSVSSEDPAFPADNLLKSEVGKHVKWKCKNVGELNAIVVLQLAEAIKFRSIDIGNCGSAFVEILVGKSCLPDAEFKVLLISTMLMTMQESKDETNFNSVRFFKPENLNQEEASDKWDRVKIICSQPFNKHIQYGLSFVKFYYSAAITTSPVVGNLGKFLLKDEESDDITPGSLFARRKDLKTDDPEVEKKGTLAASIRAADASLNTTKAESSTPKVKKARNPATSIRAGNASVDSSSESSPSSSKVKKTENSVRNTIKNDESKKRKNSPASKDNGPSSNVKIPRRNVGGPTPPKKAKIRVTRPFNKLMEGVVFVISGFQNPLRSDIRSKGLEMGAKYRADWDRQSTHLICAFPNTPKFNQVRGQGKIVKKDWIEDSYDQRIRFPWRRYSLDTRDMNNPESEDEVYEETNDPIVDDDNVASTSNTVGSSRLNSISDDEEDSPKPSLFPHLEKKSPVGKAKPSADVPASQSNMDVDEEPVPNSVNTRESSEKKVDKSDTGDSDTTQTDSEWAAEVEKECLQLPDLGKHFSGLSVFISTEYDEDMRKKLGRYITAHSGSVHPTFNSDVEFVISDQTEVIAEWKKQNPLIVGIKSEWVWRCHDEERLIPLSKFEL